MNTHFTNRTNYITTSYGIAFLFLALIFSACGRSVSFMKYNSNTYSPTDSVDVFRNNPIDKEYIELGELSIGLKSKDEDAVLLLVNKAKQIGADAIILIGETSEGETTIPIKNIYTGQTMFYMSNEDKYLKAIAIKYQD